MSAADLDALLAGAASDGALPGCAAMVWRAGRLRYAAAHGVLATHRASPLRGRPVTLDTRYDLASLTKVLATTTLVAQEVEAGRWLLDARLPTELAVVDDGRPTLVELLEHAAGLAAHREFFAPPRSLRPGKPDQLVAAVREAPPETAPGRRAIYSDLGFILLGAWLERHAGAALDQLFAARVTAARGLSDALGFRRLSHQQSHRPSPHDDSQQIAPTEVYAPSLHGGARPSYFALREALGAPVAHGVVHDDNCVLADGVAGHAGLFGTAGAVLELGKLWLERSAGPWARFVVPSTVPGSTRRLGFDGPSPDGSGSTGKALSPASFGHLGFTGTSLWIDPHAAAVYVLLTNRVHPIRTDLRIRSLRRRFHELAARL